MITLTASPEAMNELRRWARSVELADVMRDARTVAHAFEARVEATR